MKLLHKQSSQCLGSEIYLFSLPHTQTAVDGSQWVERSPVSTITSSSPIEFIVSGSDKDYMDLNNTLLEAKACIKTTNDSPVDAAVAVTPINNTLHSLFCQYVSLNDVNISSATTTYPYRAYIETHFNYGTDAIKIKASSSDVFYR